MVGGTDPLQHEQNFIPVRGCLSVAVGGPMRGPNPREGIHPAMLEWPFEVPPHRVGRPWPRQIGVHGGMVLGVTNGTPAGQSFGRNGLPFHGGRCGAIA